MKRRFVTAFAVALLALARPALAADADDAPRVRDESRVTHGMAEVSAGLLMLPGAEVCTQGVGCSKGDTSLAFSAWPLFRRGNFAAGAGVMAGVTSSTDAPRNDPPGIDRNHSRRYLSIEMTARYYVPFSDRIDGWVGIATGLGVVNDTFQSKNGVTDYATIGARGAVLLTEGYTIGLGLGVTYAFTKNWRAGAGFRAENWFLPKTAAKDPLGDEASFTGRVTTLEFGLNLSYRTRLVF